MEWSHDPVEPSRIALLSTGALVVGGLALTESFAELPAAVAAYGGAWWALGLRRRAPTGAGETR